MLLKYIIYVIVFLIDGNVCRGIKERNLTNGIEIKTFEIPAHVWAKAMEVQSRQDTTSDNPITLVVPIYVESESSDVEANIDAAVSEEPPIPEVPVQDPAVADAPIAAVADTPAANTTQRPSPGIFGQGIRYPCACRDGQCGCCTGMFFQRWRQGICANMTFLAEEFVFDMRMTMNNNTILRRKVSVSDPPPVCFNPRRIPFVEVCATISNIRLKNRQAHACLDIDANIGGFDVYSASFNCFSLGTQGVRTGLQPQKAKPSGGPAAVSLFNNGNNDDDDDEDGGLFGGGDDDDGPFDGLFDGEGGGLFDY